MSTPLPLKKAAAIGRIQGVCIALALALEAFAYWGLETSEGRLALYGQAKNKALARADWKALQLGYLYDFSRRTGLYAAYGVIDNDPAAAIPFARSLGTFAAGSTPKAAIVGIKHIF